MSLRGFLLEMLASMFPLVLMGGWMTFRHFFPNPMDQALEELEGDVIKLPTVDEILFDAQAREQARRHIGSVGFDLEGFQEAKLMERNEKAYSVIFVTRVDGGSQTLERRVYVSGDEHLSRAKQLAAILGVEFSEI